MFNLLLPSLGVVPILVSGGAALLPALLAGAASVIALIFKPKALLAACKRRPGVALGVVAAVAAVIGAIFLIPTTASAAPAGRGGAVADSGSTSTDWRAVAIEVLRQEKAAPSTKPAATDTPAPAAADARPVMLGFDAARTSYDSGPAPRELTEAARYTDEIDGPAAMILCSPLVFGDSVYGGTAVLDPPSNYGTLFRLDRETLKARWVVSEWTDAGEKVELKGIFATPAITADGARLIAGQGLHPDANCALVCVDTASGKLLWRAKTPLHIESSPAIEGDVVVVGCGAIEDPNDHTKLLSHPGFVLAVRVSDGKELWRYDVADPESSPAFVDGVVYIGSGFNGNALVALRSDTDEELAAKNLDRLIWKTPTKYPMTGPVTVAGDLVVAGGGNGNFVFSDPNPAGQIIALDKATGKVRWETTIGDSGLGAISWKDGVLICGSRTGEVLALDPKDGAVLWRKNVGGKAPIVAGPAFTGKTVYISAGNGTFLVLDAENGGEVLGTHFLNDPAKVGELGLTASTPVVAGGDVYVGSETGGLIRFTGGAVEP